MTTIRRRSVLWGGAALGLVALAWWALLPSPVVVQTALITRGPLEGVVVADGITRVDQPWTVSAPVAGVLDRPPVREGDEVQAGQTVVARLRPTLSPFLDTRSQAQAEAAVAEALAALDLAKVHVVQAEEADAYARSQMARMETLAERGAASPAALEAARRDAATADRNRPPGWPRRR